MKKTSEFSKNSEVCALGSPGVEQLQAVALQGAVVGGGMTSLSPNYPLTPLPHREQLPYGGQSARSRVSSAAAAPPR